MQVCTPCRQPRQDPTTQFFTGRMPFLTPNQQRQSTEGTGWASTRRYILPLTNPSHHTSSVFLPDWHNGLWLLTVFSISGFALVPCGRLSWFLPAFDRTLISHSYLLTYLLTYSCGGSQKVIHAIFWVLRCKKKITEADAQTIRLDATPSRLLAPPMIDRLKSTKLTKSTCSYLCWKADKSLFCFTTCVDLTQTFQGSTPSKFHSFIILLLSSFFLSSPRGETTREGIREGD